jgi:hypothetical protein
VNFATGGWTLGADQLFHLCFLIAAIATLVLGASVLARKPHLPAARAFAGICWALALANHTAVVAHAPDEMVPSWLHTLFAHDGWTRLALAAAVFFLTLFPEPKPVYRRYPGWVSGLLFGPALLLLLVHGAYAHSVWRFQPGSGPVERSQRVLGPLFLQPLSCYNLDDSFDRKGSEREEYGPSRQIRA